MGKLHEKQKTDSVDKPPFIIKFKKGDAVDMRCAESSILDRCVMIDFDMIEREPVGDMFLHAKEDFEVIVRGKKR